MKKKPYGRKDYSSRGKLPQRDFLGEIITNNRSCEICNSTLVRKRSPRGVLETYARFNARRTCGNEYNIDGKSVPTACRTSWYKIPQNCGRYIGIMHRKCRICGKSGLCYTPVNRRPEICGSCLLTNRPTPHNKQDTQTYSCNVCGKPCTDRTPKGKLKKNYKFWNMHCSRECYFQRQNKLSTPTN